MLDILLTNREAVLAALDAHAEELLAVRELLEACAEESLLAWLEAAKNSYLQYRREKFDD
jgi:prephenate dehydrogenase